MHDSCSHKMGGGIQLFRPRKRAMALLCICSCHSTCPMGNRREVGDDEWLEGCTCPGSSYLREIQLRVKKEADQRRSQEEDVIRDIDLGHGKSAQQIQREILAAYEAKGYEAPSDFSRVSRFAAASTARRGTRTARLLVEVVRGLRALRRWALDTSETDSIVDRCQNEAELGRLRRAVGLYIALAATAATGAYLTKGFVRLGLAFLSALFGATSGWVGLWAVTFGSITKSRRAHPDPTPIHATGFRKNGSFS